MSVSNIQSESWCRMAYMNYYKQGNTMNLSAADIQDIKNYWGETFVASWDKKVSDDDNAYDIDDVSYDNAKKTGKDNVKEDIGYDGSKAGQIARTTGDAVLGLAASTVGKQVVKKGIENAALNGGGKGIVKKLLQNGMKKQSGTQAAKFTEGQAAKNAGKSAGCIVGCVAGAASAAAYWAKTPNKEQKEACAELQNVMVNNQNALLDTQREMEDYNEELMDLSDQATAANENANDQIEKQKSEYDKYKKSYLELKARIENGEVLSEDDKSLYEELIKMLTEAGININDLVEEAGDEVSDIYDEMSSYEDGYNYAAETIAEVQGSTDFAESIDSSTQIQLYIECGVKGIEGVQTGKAAVEAYSLATSGSWFFGSTAWAYGFAVMGTAAAAGLGRASLQQFQWAGEVGHEIDSRKATQDLNTETLDDYTEKIDYYDGYMTGVEDLELLVPEDIESPKDAPAPTSGGDKAGFPNGTPDPLVTPKVKEDDDKKDK